MRSRGRGKSAIRLPCSFRGPTKGRALITDRTCTSDTIMCARLAFTYGIHTLSLPSGRYTFGSVCRRTVVSLPLNPCDSDTPPALNLTVELLVGLNVSSSQAVPTITRRIKICGDKHYDMAHLASLALSRWDLARLRTIIVMYTQTNATDVELPIPIDTKKAMPESVYGSTDSTTIVTTAKYKPAYSFPRYGWTALPCCTTR